VISGKLTDGIATFLIPGQSCRTRRQIVRTREIQERRQQRTWLDLTGVHELRYRECPHYRFAVTRLALMIDVGKGTIGCAQVDADEVAGHWLDSAS
jgi:hypothetical protein